MENNRQSSELGKNRIEALSDGIFAVAMTLLIFDFHVPALPHTPPTSSSSPALLQLWPKFITYAVSFLSLGVFWIGHHNMYHAVRRADRVLLGLSILFFMFVAFLPFSTSVLNAFLQTQAGLLFFGANLTIIGWLLFLQWAYAASQPGMLAEFVTPEHRALVRVRFLLYPIVVTLTMLLCFWSVPISLTIYLLLLPLYMIPSTARNAALPNSGPQRSDGSGLPRPKRRTAAGRPHGRRARRVRRLCPHRGGGRDAASPWRLWASPPSLWGGRRSGLNCSSSTERPPRHSPAARPRRVSRRRS